MKSNKTKSAYKPHKFEPKWQEVWEKELIYSPDIKNAKKPYYNLMMFPYPSAEGLHVGNMYAFTGVDIHGRFMRMRGYDVFEPIGLDGFGIHSENYALKVNRHPKKQAKISEENFYRQLRATGNAYDWTRTVETYDPDYYRWTQWLFVRMFKQGLAYRDKAEVNWCPSCKTVLADEQVIQKFQIPNPPAKQDLASQDKSQTNSPAKPDPALQEKSEIQNSKQEVKIGVCERCSTAVIKKELEQWFFRITAYADRLLENTYKPIFYWPDKVKIGQRNWIGKKEGINITYNIKDSQETVTCFTTRPDTNFGATFVVLAPEHPLIHKITASKYKKDIDKYIEKSRKKTKEDRMAEGRKKTGVFTGTYATNQLTNETMPIWVADFVLMEFGTGAVVGVPGHDRRDFELASVYNLPVERVVVIGKGPVRSYLMGGEDISDAELKSLDIFIVDKNSSGTRKLQIPRKSIKKYKELIRQKLTPGFWNEIVGDEVWFYFKEKDGKNHEFVLDQTNREQVARLCTKLNKDEIEKTRNIWLYLAENDWYTDYLIQEGEGVMINSEFLNGMDIYAAKEKIMDYIVDKGWGERVITYHLRDWLISRQRYWGAPIPMIYCPKCAGEGKSWISENGGQKTENSKQKTDSTDPSSVIRNQSSVISHPSSEMFGWFPVPERDLPVLLPDVKDWKPKGTGRGPLAGVPEFYKTKCPYCGGEAKRETDVCDTFLDSSWYFLRYPFAKTQNSKLKTQNQSLKLKTSEGNLEIPWDNEVIKNWIPVDSYIGGAEHTVLHLLYARFIWMALKDQNLLAISSQSSAIRQEKKENKNSFDYIDHYNPDEPFKRFFAHGLIIKDGAKMSKSKGNVVIPDEYIQKYGADTLRTYLMFIGPFEGGGDFRDTGIAGMYKWLSRVWRLVDSAINNQQLTITDMSKNPYVDSNLIDKQSNVTGVRLMAKTIHSVTHDMAELKYNTAVARLMEWTNWWKEHPDEVALEMVIDFLKLLAPFAPHMSEELFQFLKLKTQNSKLKTDGKISSIHLQPWPSYDESLLKEKTVTVVVQVNGKLRDSLDMEAQISKKQTQVQQKALASDKVQKWLKQKKIKQTIFVPGRLINFVI